MTNEEMWNCEDAIMDLDADVDVPAWIDRDISPSDVAAIVQGGCESGAYMPAVTYYDAERTMRQYGDEVLDFIEQAYGNVPQPPSDTSWAGRACFFLSTAVELWADGAESVLEDFEPEEEAA